MAAAESPVAAAAAAEGEMAGAKRRKPLKVEIGNLTFQNTGQLKKLNRQMFPEGYDVAESFAEKEAKLEVGSGEGPYYPDLLKHLAYSRLGFYADILVSSICCRVEERPTGGNLLYVTTLSVLEAYRRRSMASQLLQWAIDKAQGKDGQAEELREICLHVQASNAGALAFFKTFGFEVVEEIATFYRKLEPPGCVLLRKVLNGTAKAAKGPDAEDDPPATSES